MEAVSGSGNPLQRERVAGGLTRETPFANYRHGRPRLTSTHVGGLWLGRASEFTGSHNRFGASSHQMIDRDPLLAVVCAEGPQEPFEEVTQGSACTSLRLPCPLFHQLDVARGREPDGTGKTASYSSSLVQSQPHNALGCAQAMLTIIAAASFTVCSVPSPGPRASSAPRLRHLPWR